jgi:hypothetical protein
MNLKASRDSRMALVLIKVSLDIELLVQEGKGMG